MSRITSAIEGAAGLTGKQPLQTLLICTFIRPLPLPGADSRKKVQRQAGVVDVRAGLGGDCVDVYVHQPGLGGAAAADEHG